MPAQSPLRRAAMPLAAWAAATLAPLAAAAAHSEAAAAAGAGAGIDELALLQVQRDVQGAQQRAATKASGAKGHTMGSDQAAFAIRRKQSQNDLDLTGSGISVPEGFYGAEDAFAFFDTTGDGVITPAELLAIFAAEAASGNVQGENNAEPCSALCAQRMLEPLDVDGSGDVSFGEFEKVAAEALEKSGTSEDTIETQHILDVLVGNTPTNDSLSLISAEQKFRHLQQVHQDALLSLDSAAVKNELQSLRIQKRSQAFGEVSKLYTFGAPSVAKTPLQNGMAGNGKFDGLRITTVDRKRFLLMGFMEKFDPVVFVWNLKGFRHPKMDVLVIRDFDRANPVHRVHCDDPQGSCENLINFPKADSPSWWMHLHLQPKYEALLTEQTIWPMATSESVLALKIYDGKSAVQDAARRFGNRLVDFHGFGAKDYVALVQDESTLDCTLVFCGTNELDDVLNDMNMRTTSYCGFETVHVGFVKEMTMILVDSYWETNFKAKLPSCNIVRATGHSLGGSLATLFTACANNVAVAEDDPHFQKLSWVPAAAELLEEA